MIKVHATGDKAAESSVMGSRPHSQSSTNIQPHLEDHAQVKMVTWEVRPRLYHLIWVCIFCFHILNGVYLMGVSWFYYWLLSNLSLWDNIARNCDVESYEDHAKKVWVFPILAALHVYSVVQMCWTSRRRSSLLLSKPKQKIFPSSVQRTTNWLNALQEWYSWIGPRGPYFDMILLLRESFEIAIQTFQAKKLATYVSTIWLNDVAVSCICINCFLTPFLDWFYYRPHNIAKHRFFCLLRDLSLDFCCAVLIPFSILWPYVHAYDSVQNYFPIELIFDDVWYIRAVQEGQVLLITSFIDFLSKTVPHLSLWLTLQSAKKLIAKVDYDVPHSLEKNKQSAVTMHSTLWKKCVYAFFLLWAVVIGAAHVHARTKTPVQGCILKANTWFISKSACTIMEANCYRLGMEEGTATNMSSLLEQIDPDAVQSLLFTHCKDLEFPRIIETFSSLRSIDIYNCSMNEWRQEDHGRLSQQTQPVIIYIYFVLVDFYEASLPEGFFLHEDIPSMLDELTCYHTNLKSLPNSLATFGVNLTNQQYDFSLFDTFPPILTEISTLGVISMEGNYFETIPSDFLKNKCIWQLDFYQNTKLKNIPEEPMEEDEDLWFINFAYTNISTIPEWMIQWYDNQDLNENYVLLSAVGTPYCEINKLTPECKNETSLCAILCQEPTFDLTWYPFDLVKAQRNPDRDV